MPNRRALVLVKVNPPRKEQEWNEWYNTTHMPDRFKIPGYLFGRRFINRSKKADIFTRGEPKYLALYDIASSDVMKSEGFKKLKEKENALPRDSFEVFTNENPVLRWGVYDQVYPENNDYQPPSSRYLLLIEHELPRQYEEEYHAFYNTEHLPAITRVPGFRTARRFVLSGEFSPIPDEKQVRRYITIYDIEKDDFFQTPEFAEFSKSPWTSRMQGKYQQRIMLLYELFYSQQAPHS